MKLIIRYFLLALFFFSFADKTFAGGPDIKAIITATLKLGYSFGKDGGFTSGLELSVIYISKNDQINFGNSFSIDFNEARTKIHIGIQAYYTIIAGIDVGPTLSISRITKEASLGYSITPFAGLLLYPYFSYTDLLTDDKIYEVGGFLRVPLFFYTNRGLKFFLDL